jgi:tryptophanyl-tRNA synthetase
VSEQHVFFASDKSAQGLRVRDLVDPTKKMSKSDETGKGVIFLSDTQETARKKIMSATTDSMANIQYDYTAQPGVSNLIDILALLGGKQRQEVIAAYAGQTQYGPLKAAVADVVCAFLADFQTKLTAVDHDTLLSKLETDERVMNDQARATLLTVQKAVGLRK